MLVVQPIMIRFAGPMDKHTLTTAKQIVTILQSNVRVYAPAQITFAPAQDTTMIKAYVEMTVTHMTTIAKPDVIILELPAMDNVHVILRAVTVTEISVVLFVDKME